MKTARQWFEDELPADIAAMAIRNAEAYRADLLDLSHDSLIKALMASFDFYGTSQGTAFWAEVVRGNYGKPTKQDVEQIINAMLERGGSFVKLLAQAWKAADSENRVKIEKTWRDLFNRYVREEV